MLGMRSFMSMSTCYRAQVNLPLSIGQKRAVSTLNYTLANGNSKCEKVARVSFETKQPVPNKHVKGMKVEKENFEAKLQTESFEEYKKSPSVQELCGNDEKKLRRAYQKYTRLMEVERAIAKKGGNPSHIV